MDVYARVKKAPYSYSRLDEEIFMRQVIILLALILFFFTNNTKLSIDADKSITPDIVNILEPMEALDIVKEAYATNFTKVSPEEKSKEYFYKLDYADYYLVYEDTDDTTGYYLFHLYEFVVDDIDTGVGHTVTYGWYWVNPYTGDIWQYP